MQKNIIKKQAEEKLQQLKDLLTVTDILAPASHQEVKEIQRRLQEAERIITVYEYLLGQNEIAGDISVHLKIMEQANNIEQATRDLALNTEGKKEEIKKIEPQKEPEIIPAAETKNIQPETRNKKQEAPNPKQEPEKPKTVSTNKRIEFSINDKYRIINELFHQSQQEFNIAVEQLNNVENWEDAKIYLNSLVSLYSWNEEKELVKTLFRIAQKRFS
jgi:hypothetical protein